MSKVRLSFVTNSSSSSFIVISARNGYETINDEVYKLGQYGETEFGWEQYTHRDIHSRINFAFLQTVDRPEWKTMLEKVIKDNSNVKEIEYVLTYDWDSGYIDHQSAACEGENIEMFDSEQDLKDFIFGVDSKIVTYNDNH